jgi:hypothetical protein
MSGNGARDIWTVHFFCGCGNQGDIQLPVKPGQPFVQIPDLWCVKCPTPLPMAHKPPTKAEASPIVRPTMLPPDLGVKS